MSKKNDITYVKQVAPFLSGLVKKEPDINSKKQIIQYQDDEYSELNPRNEDEKPQIVVLNKSDVSEAEYNELNKMNKDDISIIFLNLSFQ